MSLSNHTSPLADSLLSLSGTEQTSFLGILQDGLATMYQIYKKDSVLFFCVAVNLAIILHLFSVKTNKTNVPLIGFPRWLPGGAHFGGLRFFYDSRQMLEEGYCQHKSGMFKIPQWSRWLFVVTGDKLVEELHQMPDETLSLLDSAKDELQIPYTMGWSIHSNPYHLHILVTNLKHHLDFLVKEVLDEMISAFDDVIGSQCDEGWNEFKTLETSTKIAARTFNRVLVGSPTCRNADYTDVSCQFAVETFVTSTIINLFPKFLHPVIGRLTTRFPYTLKRAVDHLGPVIEERRKMAEVMGNDWHGKPLDVLSWLMDAAEGPELKTEALAARVLVVNAATIHTSSMSFTQALVNLATRPEYIEPMRLEIEASIRANGWKKIAFNQMPLLDSFFKESMRLNGLGSIGFPRKAVQAFSFSDGTHVPAGSFITTAFATHFDEVHYRNANSFDGYRFMKDGMVRTSARYLSFGHGKHSCPGRFIASYFMKALMAHILINYDVKMGGDGTRPSDSWFGYACSPNRSSTIWFKRRVRGD